MHSSGGIFNVAGDWFFVFVCDMGIFGAGLATALGQVLSICILISHFFTKQCSLRIVKPSALGADLAAVLSTGFSTFFIDIAMGGLSLMLNNQIMRWCGVEALAVYGVIININILVQSCAYGIGQAAQPLISVNYGAKKIWRIRQTFFWSMVTVAVVSGIWTGVTMAFPLELTSLFMEPTAEIVQIGPAIMGSYFLSFLLLPLNIYSTYYFQAILKPAAAFGISVLRGLVFSGALIYALPALLGSDALWVAMPATELLTAVLSVGLMVRYNRSLFN